MFKSWINDLREYSEKRGKNVDSEYRLPGKPNTLVGTPGYFKYAARQTPGNVNGVTTKNLQDGGKPYVGYGMNFINKYRAKKSKP